MNNREKVIEGLKRCKPAWFTISNCERDDGCPYDHFGHYDGGCVDHLIDDVLELLEYQEVKPPKILPDHRFGCPTCGVEIIQIGNYCFCCGQKLDWEALQIR